MKHAASARRPGFGHVIEALYAAALGETDWSPALAGLAGAVDARTATLWAGTPAAGRFDIVQTRNIAPEASVAFAAHWHRFEPWLDVGSPTNLGRVHLGRDLVPEDELRRTAYYNEFCGPLGIHDLICGMAATGPAGRLGFGLHRPAEAPRFSEAERARVGRLLPHMRRAVQLHLRLRSETRVPALGPLGIAALDQLAQGVLVLDQAGALLHANPMAEALARPGGCLRLALSGVTAVHPMDRTAFAAAIADAAHGGPGATLLLHPSGEALPVAALVAPLPARPEAASARAVLILLRPLAPGRLPPEAMARLFGLTLAEADVAVRLAAGATAEEVAAARGVGVGTVRGQVRDILAKTGTETLRSLSALAATLAADQRA